MATMTTAAASNGFMNRAGRLRIEDGLFPTENAPARIFAFLFDVTSANGADRASQYDGPYNCCNFYYSI
jgi:hypothetical protein